MSTLIQSVQLRILVAVALGCSIGGIFRYVFQLLGGVLFPGFPAGTVLVNLIGSFLAGLLIPWLTDMNPITRGFLLTGFLGGLTTMSSFALDMYLFIDSRRIAYAAIYWLAGAVGCICTCILGARVSRMFLP